MDESQREVAPHGPVGHETAWIYDSFASEASPSVIYDAEKHLVYAERRRVKVPLNYVGLPCLVVFYVKERLKSQSFEALQDAWPEPWTVLDSVLTRLKNHTFAKGSGCSEFLLKKVQAIIAPGVQIPALDLAPPAQPFPKKPLHKKTVTSHKEVKLSYLDRSMPPKLVAEDMLAHLDDFRRGAAGGSRLNMHISCAALCGRTSPLPARLTRALRGLCVLETVASFLDRSCDDHNGVIKDEPEFWLILRQLMRDFDVSAHDLGQFKALASFLSKSWPLCSAVNKTKREFRAQVYSATKMCFGGGSWPHRARVVRMVTCTLVGGWSLALRFSDCPETFQVEFDLLEAHRDVQLHVTCNRLALYHQI